MKVGWLHDDPGYVGGAELTQAEFRAKAPQGVEVVDCPMSGVVAGLDCYVVHNCALYDHTVTDAFGEAPVIKYVNDCWPHGDPFLRDWLLSEARLIFTSPLHLSRFPYPPASGVAAHMIPPALDLLRFQAVKGRGDRKGNVCIGRMAYGKGIDLLEEHGEPIDVYSTVPISNGHPNLTYKGQVKPLDVPRILSQYKTFVFLPTALEPFGRAVVEAWAAGCELHINRNVGARYWIKENPKGLESAAEDFWRVVLHG